MNERRTVVLLIIIFLVFILSDFTSEKFSTSYNSSVTCNSRKCIKKYQGKSPTAPGHPFMKELEIYKKDLGYVPDLLDYDEKNRVLEVENLLPKQTPSQKETNEFGNRREFSSRAGGKEQVQKLLKKFKSQTGYHHNDMATPMNSVKGDDGKVYLIDFELTSLSGRPENNLGLKLKPGNMPDKKRKQ